VGEFQAWEPQPDHEAARFIEDMSGVDLFPRGSWVQLGIAERYTDELIGDVGICVSADGEKAEIGFTVAPRAQGSGLGTEAVRAVIGLIFDHTGVSKVVAVIDARNIRAHRLVLRVGFQKVESLRTVFRGEPCIEDVWAVSRADTTTGARSRLVSDQAGPQSDHVDRADEGTTRDVPRVAG
jgi:RimJ/RimL family protein N-acetyltransferase